MNPKITLGVVVIAISAIAAACSEGGIDLMHVCPPRWNSYSPAVTFMYLLVAPVIALRAADARVIAALPIIGNTAVASFAVFEFLRILSDQGYVSRRRERGRCRTVRGDLSMVRCRSGLGRDQSGVCVCRPAL